jgi:hypothetical protein
MQEIGYEMIKHEVIQKYKLEQSSTVIFVGCGGKNISKDKPDDKTHPSGRPKS